MLFIGFVATSYLLWLVANEWFYFIKEGGKHKWNKEG